MIDNDLMERRTPGSHQCCVVWPPGHLGVPWTWGGRLSPRTSCARGRTYNAPHRSRASPGRKVTAIPARGTVPARGAIPARGGVCLLSLREVGARGETVPPNRSLQCLLSFWMDVTPVPLDGPLVASVNRSDQIIS